MKYGKTDTSLSETETGRKPVSVSIVMNILIAEGMECITGMETKKTCLFVIMGKLKMLVFDGRNLYFRFTIKRAMKKQILFVFCLLSVLNSMGQIIDRKNSWNFLEVLIPICKKSPDCEGKFYQNHRYSFGNDTLINGKTYAIVLQSLRRSVDTITYTNKIGFLRDEENHKKVYFLSEQYEATEVLLYDFTLKIDSVLEMRYHGTAKVVNLDSIDVNGTKKLRIQFDQSAIYYLEDIPSTVPIEWIEDIGSMQGLLFDQFSGPLTFLCFKQNNNLLYFLETLF